MTLIQDFTNAGILSELDRHLAMSLGRISGESRPEALLGAALASRAPRHGHICIELHEVSKRIPDPDLENPLPWPEPSQWRSILADSPMVRNRQSESPTPLVLDGDRLYLDRYWQYQERLRRQLLKRAVTPPFPVHSERLKIGLDQHFPPGQPAFSRQRIAAMMAVLKPLTFITGGPGTGKTTTVAAILALLADQAAEIDASKPLRIGLAAPTGKAADRVAESIEEGLQRLELSAAARTLLSQLKSQTLHQLLGWQPLTPTRFRHHADHPLPHDVVIIDEASMVDLSQWSKLLDAVRPDARLILLGDRDQLASVEAGAVLADICGPLDPEHPMLSGNLLDQLHQCGGIPLEPEFQRREKPGVWDSIVPLVHTWRFGIDTGIGQVAQAVRMGDFHGAIQALNAPSNHDLHLQSPPPEPECFNHPLPPSILQTILAALVPAIEYALKGQAVQALAQLSQLRVMAAHRRGPLGLEALNQYLASALAERIPSLNPSSEPWLGMPILIRENDRSLDVRNGQTGILVRGPEGSSGLFAAVPQGNDSVRLIGLSRLPRFDPMLSMTIHQSQGSQFEHAVLVLPLNRSPILTRELIYTGITRARKQVTIVGSEPILKEAISAEVQRASGLSGELWHTAFGSVSKDISP